MRSDSGLEDFSAFLSPFPSSTSTSTCTPSPFFTPVYTCSPTHSLDHAHVHPSILCEFDFLPFQTILIQFHGNESPDQIKPEFVFKVVADANVEGREIIFHHQVQSHVTTLINSKSSLSVIIKSPRSSSAIPPLPAAALSVIFYTDDPVASTALNPVQNANNNATMSDHSVDLSSCVRRQLNGCSFRVGSQNAFCLIKLLQRAHLIQLEQLTITAPPTAVATGTAESSPPTPIDPCGVINRSTNVSLRLANRSSLFPSALATPPSLSYIQSSFPHESAILHSFFSSLLSPFPSSPHASPDTELPANMKAFGSTQSKTLLVVGAEGTGKTYMIDKFCEYFSSSINPASSSSPLHVFSLTTLQLACEPSGSTLLLQTYEAARRSSPSLLIFEDADDLVREANNNDWSSQLLKIVEEMSGEIPVQLGREGNRGNGNVGLIIVVHSIEVVASRWRRAGRFDRELHMKVFTSQQRMTILQHIIQEHQDDSFDMRSISETDIKRLADLTPGFTVRGLEAALKFAILSAQTRMLQTSSSSTVVCRLQLEWSDWESAIARYKPTATSSSSSSISSSSFSSFPSPSSSSSSSSSSRPLLTTSFHLIAGYSSLKRRLSLTLSHWLSPSLSLRLLLPPPRGLLLHGESGVGKSHICRIMLQTTSGLNWLRVSGSDVYSAYYGESEKRVKEAFRKAREWRPCVIWIEEIDQLIVNRDETEGEGGEGGGSMDSRILSTFLNEMDGITSSNTINSDKGGHTISGGVYVLATTNRLSSLDSALLRPGRFDLVLPIPLPSSTDRIELFQLYTTGKQLAEDVSLEELVERCKGVTGSEVREVCREAEGWAAREEREEEGWKRRKEKGMEGKIEMKHFNRALIEMGVE